MGRRKRPNQMNKKKSDGERRSIKNINSYEDLKLGNPNFEKYYKLQKICPDEEWESFISILKSELPAAFRITNFKSEAKGLLNVIKGKYFQNFFNGDTGEDNKNVYIVPLPWYPNNLGWQLKLSRRDIRRSEALFQLHNFLISETDSGSISRQEVVSMIPPLVLDIKSNHKILDMCAAPGSKTAQLIEYLHQNQTGIPEGFVIANDMDNNRCYMLVHQAKRLNSPNIIITNHDATCMPNFNYTDSEGKESVVKFDRILCDVPCTGDGTLRKNPDIWVKWNSVNANNLHGVQYRIAKRGSEMLEIGGRMVYSTCSLNPIENESVLARLLLEADGALELVDVSNFLPGLKYSKGLTEWMVTSKDIIAYEKFEDVPVTLHTILRPHMFCPDAEVADKLKLNRCIRVLPHFQDTGGFFLAVVEKVSKLPWEAKEKSSDQEQEVEEQGKPREPTRKKRRVFGYREDPFVFFDKTEPVWEDIKNFYGFNEFPVECLLTRCVEGKKKNIYLTSAAVRDIVLKNAQSVKIINTGVKTFARCSSKDMNCQFRLVQEGLWGVLSFMSTKRHIEIFKDDLIAMLSCEDLNKPPLTVSLTESSQKAISTIGHGSCVLIYKGLEEDLYIELVGWIGVTSTKAYISRNEAIHYLRLLGADTSNFEKNKFKKETTEEAIEQPLQEEEVTEPTC